MRLTRMFISLLTCIPLITNALASESTEKIINNGLRYLASIQLEYGEFPTIFYPNSRAPDDVKYASYDSNIFMSAMIADAIHVIPHPLVTKINDNVSRYLLEQLNNTQGLWSYFTSHNPHPLYPATVYDLDDTALASIVLHQNKFQFPDNREIIKKNKDSTGAYFTFFESNSDVDCGVNANVLSWLQEQDPEVCRYLNRAVASGEKCAWYYSKLDAYYLISRAWQSGVECLRPSLPFIREYVLTQLNGQDNVDNNIFETAIAANTLLDLGYDRKELSKVIEYIIQQQSLITGGWGSKPFWLWSTTDENGDEILLGRSGSSGITTALALKAIYHFSKLN